MSSKMDLGLGENELTEEEKGWAATLQLQAQKDGILIENTFMLHAFALLGKGDLKKGLFRAKHWNEICAQWGLRETAQDAATAWMRNSTFEEFFLTAGRDEEGRLMMCTKMATFIPKDSLKTDEDWRFIMRALSDNMRAMTPTLRDVRNGACIVSWMKGYGWRNVNPSVERKLASIYQDSYPVKMKRIVVIDPPLIFRAVMKVFSVFMKKKLIDRIVLMSEEEVRSGNKLPLDQTSADLGGSMKENWWDVRASRLATHHASVQALGPLVPLQGV
mmetsp:Transcript_17958/g.40311  ORF Transcript_17958/g.40311 Transcript_17958/m.40311 type:complete len:274 (+) Transcript_17958:47-868(+)